MARRLQLALLTLMLFVALSFSLERQAHAYVDPGSGILLFQSLTAMVSGALFYFRRRIKSLFTKTSPKSADPINTPLPGPR
jgi:drug/metabolite transporter (DMT)-like permease